MYWNNRENILGPQPASLRLSLHRCIHVWRFHCSMNSYILTCACFPYIINTHTCTLSVHISQIMYTCMQCDWEDVCTI